MSQTPETIHGVQLFVIERGKLAQGRCVQCKGAADACRIAEERVKNGRAVGAAAFSRTIVDADYDDVIDPVTLAIFGRVPPGLAEQLPF